MAKPPNITEPAITRRPRITRIPQADMLRMPACTPRRPGRPTPRNTARSKRRDYCWHSSVARPSKTAAWDQHGVAACCGTSFVRAWVLGRPLYQSARLDRCGRGTKGTIATFRGSETRVPHNENKRRHHHRCNRRSCHRLCPVSAAGSAGSRFLGVRNSASRSVAFGAAPQLDSQCGTWWKHRAGSDTHNAASHHRTAERSLSSSTLKAAGLTTTTNE
jgi:hypothetical protein